LSTDGVVIQELIQKYGEHGARRIINSASHYFWDQDRKKEEKDRKEILEHPHVLAYIEHFKSWVNSEVKKAGYQMYKSKDRIDFETFAYEMGWYSIINVKFDYSVCLVPIDLKKKSLLAYEREERDLRHNLPYKFYETHQPLRYVEISRDNQYGAYLDLACDVSDMPTYELLWPELYSNT
jgi:hypothetical protein